MADLALKMAQTEQSGLMTALSMLFLFVFGAKAAIFPLFFWLPDSYPEPPTAVSAIFGGLLTKVGVYALIRTFTLLCRTPLHPWLHPGACIDHDHRGIERYRAESLQTHPVVSHH